MKKENAGDDNDGWEMSERNEGKERGGTGTPCLIACRFYHFLQPGTHPLLPLLLLCTTYVRTLVRRDSNLISIPPRPTTPNQPGQPEIASGLRGDMAGL